MKAIGSIMNKNGSYPPRTHAGSQLVDSFGSGGYRLRPHPNYCEVGDLYRPWYFYEGRTMSLFGRTHHKYSKTGCDKNIRQVCLVFKIETAELDPNEIVSSSFLVKPSTDHRRKYLGKGLTDSIKDTGQKNRIICTKHYIKDAPVRINFLEDPELEKIKCFEGHHRMVSCEDLGIPVKAEVYHLYHMDLLQPPVDELPRDWKKGYQSNYDDSFWLEWREEDRSLARKTNQIALVPVADDKNWQEHGFNQLGISYKLIPSWKQDREFYVLWP